MQKRLCVIISLFAMMISSIASARDIATDSLRLFLNKDFTPTVFRLGEVAFNRTPMLDDLVAAIKGIEKDSLLRLDSIEVTIASSWDGPQKGNYDLALRRCRSFIDYLSYETKLEKEHFRAHAIDEDWDYTLVLLEDHPEYYSRVKSLIGLYPQYDEREKAIRADSLLWAYIKSNVLPYTRYARVMVRGVEMQVSSDSTGLSSISISVAEEERDDASFADEPSLLAVLGVREKNRGLLPPITSLKNLLTIIQGFILR